MFSVSYLTEPRPITPSGDTEHTRVSPIPELRRHREVSHVHHLTRVPGSPPDFTPILPVVILSTLGFSPIPEIRRHHEVSHVKPF